jgi:HEPN domain-containing protein
MSESEARVDALRWLRYAAEDLRTAERLLGEAGVPPRQACYLAQQAAEKALKAVLVLLQIDFPRTHDLDRLRGLIPSRWSVATAHPDLAALSAWVAEARYPGDWPDATEPEAREAVNQARAVVTSVVADLTSHGPAEATTFLPGGTH